MTSWFNRYALQDVDGAQVWYAFLASLGLFAVMYVVAHYIDKNKKL